MPWVLRVAIRVRVQLGMKTSPSKSRSTRSSPDPWPPLTTTDGSHAVDAARRLSRVVQRADGHAGQDFGLGNVRRHDQRARQQLRCGSPARRRRRAAVAALGHHHRIDDDQRQLELRDRRRDGFDDRRVAEHAGLGGVNRDVAGDRFDLRGDEIGRRAATTAVTPTVFCAVMAVIALVP